MFFLILFGRKSRKHYLCKTKQSKLELMGVYQLDWDTHQIIQKTENASLVNGGPHKLCGAKL